MLQYETIIILVLQRAKLELTEKRSLALSRMSVTLLEPHSRVTPARSLIFLMARVRSRKTEMHDFFAEISPLI